MPSRGHGLFAFLLFSHHSGRREKPRPRDKAPADASSPVRRVKPGPAPEPASSVTHDTALAVPFITCEEPPLATNVTSD